jgi:hypothetical protein
MIIGLSAKYNRFKKLTLLASSIKKSSGFQFFYRREANLFESVTPPLKPGIYTKEGVLPSG